jgi:lycopene cyclase domain-containing protein
MKSEYLIVLAAIVIFPAILSRDPKIGIRGNWKPLVKAMGITCAVFWVWDIIATARGHWSFNPAYVLGWTIAGMPIEEWLFFVVVSFVSVFTWEATKYFTGRR